MQIEKKLLRKTPLLAYLSNLPEQCFPKMYVSQFLLIEDALDAAIFAIHMLNPF
jgi:hypothetical protein